MSVLTKFLKLFQYDKEQDADSTFNISLALNQNWDKVDAGFAALDAGKAAADHTHAPADMGADPAGAAQVVQGNLQTHMADNARHVSAAERTAWGAKAEGVHAHTKAQVGLGNVDNTADSQKSVKYAATSNYAATAGSANAVGGVAAGNVFSTAFKPWVTGTYPSSTPHVALGFRPSAVIVRVNGVNITSGVDGTATAACYLALDGAPMYSLPEKNTIFLEIVADGFTSNIVAGSSNTIYYMAFR